MLLRHFRFLIDTPILFTDTSVAFLNMKQYKDNNEETEQIILNENPNRIWNMKNAEKHFSVLNSV